jgi:hypothetical protein
LPGIVSEEKSLKQIRREVEQELGLPKDCLKNAEVEGVPLTDVVTTFLTGSEGLVPGRSEETEDSPEEAQGSTPEEKEVRVEELECKALKRTAFEILWKEGAAVEALTAKRLRRETEKNLQLAKGALKKHPTFDAASALEEFLHIKELRDTVQAENENAVGDDENADNSLPAQQPYSYSLLKRVFLYLNGLRNLDEVTLKSVRRQLENEMGLPGGGLRPRTPELKLIMDDYRLFLRLRRQTEERGQRTLTRYSKKEERIIVGVVKEFLDDNALDQTTLCYNRRGLEKLRIPRETKKLLHHFYKELLRMMPHRTMFASRGGITALQKFVDYKLSLELLAKWTAEDEQALVALVDLYGRKWVRIAKLMGRRAGDLHDKWRRMRGTYGNSH